jgi:hypothetical protein
MLPSLVVRYLPPVFRRVQTLQVPVTQLAPILSREASNYAKPQVTEEKVDANILVSKDLAKMFEEIHQELDSEMRHDVELTEMSK